MGIEILYEDNHLLIAVKPPNVPVQGDISGTPDLLTLLKEDIKIRYNKPGNVFLGLVHRLDRPVGGVMVFARTSKAASRLSEQIRNHQMGKIYLCVVKGCPEHLKGRLTDYLLKDRDNNIVSVVEQGTSGAKQAVLDYEVLKNSEGLSLIKLIYSQEEATKSEFKCPITKHLLLVTPNTDIKGIWCRIWLFGHIKLE